MIDCRDMERPILCESEPFRRQIAAEPLFGQQRLSSSYTSSQPSPADNLTDFQPSNRRTDPPLLLPHCKIPVGDGPYVRAKIVQLVERDPDRAIALFWAAVNAGDRVDSALKDMAIVMKQQNRPEEAIEAIKSFRGRCSDQAQESLDNVLLDLYKKCGKFDEQISLLKHKLNLIHKGLVFNGKRSKTARSHGKKVQISVGQEATRLLGNLGWTYMQLSNFAAAEAVYRKALSIEPDNNKLCNLGVCLLQQGKCDEARIVLKSATPAKPDGRASSESSIKSYERSLALLEELEASCRSWNIDDLSSVTSSETSCVQEFDLWSHWKLWEPPKEDRQQFNGSESSDSSEGVLGEIEEVGEKRNALPVRHGLRHDIEMAVNALPVDNFTHHHRLRVFRDISDI